MNVVRNHLSTNPNFKSAILKACYIPAITARRHPSFIRDDKPDTILRHLLLLDDVNDSAELSKAMAQFLDFASSISEKKYEVAELTDADVGGLGVYLVRTFQEALSRVAEESFENGAKEFQDVGDLEEEIDWSDRGGLRKVFWSDATRMKRLKVCNSNPYHYTRLVNPFTSPLPIYFAGLRELHLGSRTEDVLCLGQAGAFENLERLCFPDGIDLDQTKAVADLMAAGVLSSLQTLSIANFRPWKAEPNFYEALSRGLAHKSPALTVLELNGAGYLSGLTRLSKFVEIHLGGGVYSRSRE